MSQGKVNAFSIDGTTPAQIQVLHGSNWTRAGSGHVTNVRPSALDGSTVPRMMRLANLNDVANYLDQCLIIDSAQVGTTGEAQGGELRAKRMIDGIVECCRDESWGLMAIEKGTEREEGEQMSARGRDRRG